MKEETEMSHIPCPKCKNKAEEIILASENKRVGWWCRTCNPSESYPAEESGMTKLQMAMFPQNPIGCPR